MPDEEKTKLRLEIAHVLFMDIVGYSKLLNDEQSEALLELNRTVRGCEAVQEAEAASTLIRLPTGDGMALVFTSTVEAPVECALQIGQALRVQPSLPLRMGIHSGPVHHVVDVNGHENIAGAGINVAQRVMDCGDAGHILVSKRVADDLAGSRRWQPYLHELGDCEVKHGLTVSLVNLYAEVIGNPARPMKFSGTKVDPRDSVPIGVVQSPRRWQLRAAATLIGLALISGLIFGIRHQSEQEQIRVEARAAKAEQQLVAVQNQLQQQTKLISMVSAKLDREAPTSNGTSRSDSADAARRETARQIGISVEELQKQLSEERGDVGALLAQIDRSSTVAETEAVKWRKLKRIGLDKLGDADIASGKFASAIEPYQQALALCDKEQDPLIWCEAGQALEIALGYMGRYAEAEPLARELVARRTALLGHDNADTLRSVSGLASALTDTGDAVTAEGLYRNVLESRERTLGRDNTETLRSAYNLANCLYIKGDLAGAEPLFRRALEGRQRTLGENDPETLISIGSLASVLQDKGDLVGAEVLNRRALSGMESTLGKDHPSTLVTVNNLGTVLDAEGKSAEAEVLYRRALETRKRTLGEEHPDTLTSYQNLASLLQQRGQLQDAEALDRKTLETQERLFGREHRTVLITVINLGWLLDIEGRYTEAEALDRRAVEVTERTLGKDHPYTLCSIDNLAGVLTDEGNFAEGEALGRRSLEARERIMGKESPDTLISVSTLAQILDAEGKYAAAEPLYIRGEQGMERMLPPDHVNRLDLDYHFSLMRQKQGRLIDALPMAERAADGARKVLPDNSPDRIKYAKNLEVLRTKVAGGAPSVKSTPTR